MKIKLETIVLLLLTLPAGLQSAAAASYDFSTMSLEELQAIHKSLIDEMVQAPMERLRELSTLQKACRRAISDRKYLTPQPTAGPALIADQPRNAFPAVDKEQLH